MCVTETAMQLRARGAHCAPEGRHRGVQEQERREDAAVPRRKDELQALCARLAAAEDSKQERYKALAARLRLLKATGVRAAAAAS